MFIHNNNVFIHIIKSDLIANDFLIERCKIYQWIHVHQFVYFCCIICWNVLFLIWSNMLAHQCCWLRPSSACKFWISRISTWMWGSTKCCLIAFFKQLWACSIALKNGQYEGNMIMWNLSLNSNETMILRYGHAWTQDDHQLIDESLKDGICNCSLFDNVVNQTMSGDIDVTFLLHGATTWWTYLHNSIQLLVLQVKMLNPNLSMYTWYWWTPMKKKLIWHKQVNLNTDLGWSTIRHIENITWLCSNDFFHCCTFQQSWW